MCERTLREKKTHRFHKFNWESDSWNSSQIVRLHCLVRIHICTLVNWDYGLFAFFLHTLWRLSIVALLVHVDGCCGVLLQLSVMIISQIAWCYDIGACWEHRQFQTFLFLTTLLHKLQILISMRSTANEGFLTRVVKKIKFEEVKWVYNWMNPDISFFFR